MNKEPEKEWSISIPSTLLRSKSLTDSLKLAIGYLKLRSGIESWVTSATDIANHVGCSTHTGIKNIGYLLKYGVLMTAGTKTTILKSGKPYEYKVFRINAEVLKKLIETPPIEATHKRRWRTNPNSLTAKIAVSDPDNSLTAKIAAKGIIISTINSNVLNNKILDAKIAVSQSTTEMVTVVKTTDNASVVGFGDFFNGFTDSSNPLYQDIGKKAPHYKKCSDSSVVNTSMAPAPVSDDPLFRNPAMMDKMMND